MLLIYRERTKKSDIIEDYYGTPVVDPYHSCHKN